jgi:hypothetical protein
VIKYALIGLILLAAGQAGWSGARPMAYGIAVGAVAIVGILADRLAQLPRVEATVARVEGRVPAGIRRNGRAIIGWAGVAAWAALLTIVFLRTSRLSGTSGLSPTQLILYVRTWFGALSIVLAVGAVGAVLALIAAFVDRRRLPTGPVTDLVVAIVAGIPLVLLVIAVGEPPRNYLAEIALGVALAAIGWVWAGERLLELGRPLVTVPLGIVGGVAAALLARQLVVVAIAPDPQPSARLLAVVGAVIGAGLGAIPVVAARSAADRGNRIRTATAVGVVAAALLASSGALAAHALAPRPLSTNPAREAAVNTVTAWLLANVDPSETVAFGSFLGYDMALGLQGRNRTVQVRHRLSVGSASAPEGMAYKGEPPSDDWIAIDTAPRNTSQFQAYRAEWLTGALQRLNVGVWVYTVGIETAAPSIIPALTPEHGFDLLEHWTFPVGTATPIETYVFRVHPDRVKFDTSTIYISSEALGRLVFLLEAHPDVAKPAARALAERAVVTPPDPGSDRLFARLRAIAGS